MPFLHLSTFLTSSLPPSLHTDPVNVIGLYPNLLPSDLRQSLSHLHPTKPPTLTGEDLDKGMEYLIEYLTQVHTPSHPHTITPSHLYTYTPSHHTYHTNHICIPTHPHTTPITLISTHHHTNHICIPAHPHTIPSSTSSPDALPRATEATATPEGGEEASRRYSEETRR